MNLSKIKIEKTPIDGLAVLESFSNDDARGRFVKFGDGGLFFSLGFATKDAFISTNKKGVLRGLHYQSKNPQAKIIFCLNGEIFDVAVDLRQGSKTYGKWFGVKLSEKNGRGLYIPKGFAHGFLSLANDSLVLYLADSEYSSETDTGIAYNDPKIAISWPDIKCDYIVSPRDLALPALSKSKKFE